MFFLSSLSFAQCAADAGPDKHSCPNDSDAYAIPLGSFPTATGTAPFTYAWSIIPIEFVLGSSFPYLYASHILNDTTLANPVLMYRDIGDSLKVFVTITDSLGCNSTDSCLITLTHFGIHLTYHEYWINQGDSVYLNQTPNIGGGFGTSTYNWSPSYGLSDTTLAYGFWASPDTTTSYTATVTDSKGCSETAGGPLYVIYVNPTSLRKVDRIPVSLYPNPTSNLIFIETDANKPILKGELYSLTAKKLADLTNLSGGIDLTPYAKGAYILKLYFDDGIAIKKVIKK